MAQGSAFQLAKHAQHSRHLGSLTDGKPRLRTATEAQRENYVTKIRRKVYDAPQGRGPQAATGDHGRDSDRLTHEKGERPVRNA